MRSRDPSVLARQRPTVATAGAGKGGENFASGRFSDLIEEHAGGIKASLPF